jgi:nitroreductase
MDVKKAIELRRAYRSLEPVEITRDMIDDLAESARLAPSCFNNQPWNFVFVTDKAQLRKLFACLSKGNEWIHEASMIAAVFGSKDKDCVVKEREYYLFDIGMSVGFILLRATEMGLVAHPIAGFNEECVKEALGIPMESRMITLINFGKKSDKLNPVLSDNQKLQETERPPRTELKDFVYYNKVK